MERRERERITRQGVAPPETPRRKRELAALREDLVEHPLQGRPLRQRYRNFTPDAGSYFASLAGPLPYMARLREIEVLVAQHELAPPSARRRPIPRTGRPWRSGGALPRLTS